jgi:hypothetical protein
MHCPCCKIFGLLWLVVAAGLLALGPGCRRTEEVKAPTVTTGPALEREAIPVPSVHFTDITGPAGIRFQHFTGAFGMKLLPETMGSGVAVIDFDNDGRPDLLFVNGCPWPGHERDVARQPTLQLYRNLGGGKFQDVTAESGVGATMYGMGATVGDYDNDGWPDLFVTGVGGCRLFHNEVGNRKGGRGPFFKDVTAEAGVGGPGGWPRASAANFLDHLQPVPFASSAAFLDYDGDGLLDLFVCHYVTWSPGLDRKLGFTLKDGQRAYGQPKAFEGAQCALYRNRGGGRFEDVSAKAGVQEFEREGTEAGARVRNVGKSLALIVCDIDEDGWPDVVVANDTVRNFLFHNVAREDGSRTFKEVGYLAGVAYAEGQARGAMGIDWAPAYRPDCLGALVIGNFADEPDTFLCLEDARRLQFSDRALAEGIAGPSRPLLKFGTLFFDYDLDGRPDLLTCNGHLEPEIAQVQPGQRYEQPVQLFWNTGRKRRGFEPATPEAAGSDLFRPLVGRGCAYLDVDGDGDLDVVLTANGEPARLLRNDGGTGHHWVRLRLEGDGRRSNRSAVGARVTLEAGGAVQKQEVASARGYLSASELVLTFGLGKNTQVDRVTIHWPGRNGGTQVLTGKDLVVDKENVIKQK